MSKSRLFLVEKCWEHEPRVLLNTIKPGTRGVYALLNYVPPKGKTKERYDVVYVGMARGRKAGILGRLRGHARSKSKRKKWNHFSAFKVWDNIPEQFVEELEGILREIYRDDGGANQLNKQKKHGPLQKVRERLEKKRDSAKRRAKK